MALVVVLVMVAMGTMLAVSTFQSSLLQERITGNQRMATLARMRAEAGIAEGRQVYSAPDSNTLSGEGAGYDYRILDADQAKTETGLTTLSPGNYILSRGYAGPDNSQIQRMILSQVASNMPNLKAVFTCFGDGCLASGVFHIDGRDHPVPDDFYCSGDSCHSEPDVNSIYQTAYYHDTDAITNQGTSSYSTNFSYEEDLQYWRDYLGSLPNDYSNSYHSFGETSEGHGKNNDKGKAEKITGVSSDHGDNKVIDIIGRARLNGNTPTSGVIIIRDGGVLNVNGTAHHEGLIIVEEGGQFGLTSGTFDLFGGIVMMNTTTSKEESDLTLKGSINVRYSSEALQGLWPLREGGDAITASWQEIY